MAQHQNYGRQDNYPPLVQSEDISKIVKQGDMKTLVEKADSLGKHFRTILTTSQIRNVFGSVKRMEQRGFEKSKKEFLLLKPKLAYAAGREYKLKELEKVLRDAIDAVGESSDGFMNFCKFFEAILCYHKFYGGK